MSSSSNTPIPFLTDRIMIGEPLPDATYTTDEELAQAYVSHSYDRGYGVVLADSQGMKRPNKLGRAIEILIATTRWATTRWALRYLCREPLLIWSPRSQ